MLPEGQRPTARRFSCLGRAFLVAGAHIIDKLHRILAEVDLRVTGLTAPF